jgi:hypothetical protein
MMGHPILGKTMFAGALVELRLSLGPWVHAHLVHQMLVIAANVVQRGSISYPVSNNGE